MTSRHETRGRPRRREFELFCAKAAAVLDGELDEVDIGTRLNNHDSFRYSAPFRDLRAAYPSYRISLFSNGMNLTLSAVRV